MIARGGEVDLSRARARLVLVLVLFGAGFLALAGRLVEFASVARGDAARRPAAVAGRGEITDRNGIILAVNLRAPSVFAHPSKVADPDLAARKLATVLEGTSVRELRDRLAAAASFVWLKRHISPREEQGLLMLGIPGVETQEDWQRRYPHGHLASHVLGYVNDDGRGLAGVERRFDDRLRGHRDEPLRLSLDLRVQTVVREELTRAVATFRARAGNAVVTDVRSGEVLAMVSLPDFDPNWRSFGPTVARFNRNTQGVYEVGSMFKLFTVAAALDAGVVDLQSRCDASRPLPIGRRPITDFQAHLRVLSLPEAIMYSSNICLSRMGIALGGARQQASLERFHLLERPSIEVPERGRPIPPDPRWGDSRSARVSYGYGVAVTPLHVAEMAGMLAGGGVWRPATLLPRAPIPKEQAERIVRPGTADAVRWLMWANGVEGSGKGALVDGYLVGGKTGTANKPYDDGRIGYDGDRRLSSFVASFPINDPRYVVLVMLDEPKPTAETGGYATGGMVASPTAGRIIRRIGPMLALAPVPGAVEASFRACLATGEAVNGRTHKVEKSFASVCASR